MMHFFIFPGFSNFPQFYIFFIHANEKSNLGPLLRVFVYMQLWNALWVVISIRSSICLSDFQYARSLEPRPEATLKELFKGSRTTILISLQVSSSTWKQADLAILPDKCNEKIPTSAPLAYLSIQCSRFDFCLSLSVKLIWWKCCALASKLETEDRRIVLDLTIIRNREIVVLVLIVCQKVF